MAASSSIISRTKTLVATVKNLAKEEILEISQSFHQNAFESTNERMH